MDIKTDDTSSNLATKLINTMTFQGRFVPYLPIIGVFIIIFGAFNCRGWISSGLIKYWYFGMFIFFEYWYFPV